MVRKQRSSGDGSLGSGGHYKEFGYLKKEREREVIGGPLREHQDWFNF